MSTSSTLLLQMEMQGLDLPRAWHLSLLAVGFCTPCLSPAVITSCVALHGCAPKTAHYTPFFRPLTALQMLTCLQQGCTAETLTC